MRKLFATLLILSSITFAQENTSHNTRSKPYDQGYGVKENQMTAGHSAPARIDATGSWDVFLMFKFLYWQPRQEGLDLATAIPVAGGTPTDIIEMDFDYKPGFKVGIGTNFGHDNWVGYTEYSWLHLTEGVSSSAPTGGNLNAGVWWVNNRTDNGGSVNANWRLRLDYLDAALARPY